MIRFQSHEQFITELKKLMLDLHITQRALAQTLGISPQGLTKLLNKKNFGFEDAKRILNAMNYDLIIDMQPANE